MLTDPVLHQLHTTREQTDLIRAGERERLAAQVHPWCHPVTAFLAPARTSVGAVIIRLGRTIQGATAMPAPRSAA